MRTNRTVLEKMIRERRQTLEEFVEYAEKFAREHDEPATLSLRHLQRLVAGRGANGRPLGTIRAVTARLLERIFGLGIDELLAAPAEAVSVDDSSAELRRRIHASRQVDSGVLELLIEQMATLRRLDRQLGAIVAHDEARTKAEQLDGLLAYSAPGNVRERLAAMLSEIRCLVAWQALDLGNVNDAWRNYEHARTAALESGLPAFEAHAAAGQAFVLIDIGETSSAAELLAVAREQAERKCSRLILAWMSAAHGEVLAANSQGRESLAAFDDAGALLPNETTDPEGPYVALNPVHLARWRGHALARVGAPEAVEVLSAALDGLDPTFARAETGLRVDLARAFAATGDPEAGKSQVDRAVQLAATLGSARQQRRIKELGRR